jgi:hypothetical protein
MMVPPLVGRRGRRRLCRGAAARAATAACHGAGLAEHAAQVFLALAGQAVLCGLLLGSGLGSSGLGFALAPVFLGACGGGLAVGGGFLLGFGASLALTVALTFEGDVGRGCRRGRSRRWCGCGRRAGRRRGWGWGWGRLGRRRRGHLGHGGPQLGGHGRGIVRAPVHAQRQRCDQRRVHDQRQCRARAQPAGRLRHEHRRGHRGCTHRPLLTAPA